MMQHPADHLILVSGATGQQGGAVIRHLLEHGFRVRALTRDASQEAARALERAGAEIAEGDFADRASLDRALEGAYGAFSVQSTWVAGPDGEVEHGQQFADVAVEAGVEHLIYSSVAGADRDTGIPHFESKWEIEQYLGTLDLDVTVFRPVSFMENWSMQRESILGGTLRLPLSPDTRLQQIAVDDIGGFVAQAFAAPDEWIGETVTLAGDDLTMQETATTFAHLLGREVRYEQVPWNVFEEQAGSDLTRMYRWMEEHRFRADIETLRSRRPELQTLATFVAAFWKDESRRTTTA